jgi:hypothetical protein
VQEFIGPTDAVLLTDAGAITAYIEPLVPTVDSLRAGLGALQTALTRVDLGSKEMLVGVDGCLRGTATHLQTVVHIRGEPRVSLSNATVKVYPASGEEQSLIGWRLCKVRGAVPDELAPARRVHTAAGVILVLVCYDATLLRDLDSFRRSLTDNVKLQIRQHLLDQALVEPCPRYIMIATHWQETNPETGRWSGESFRQAARYLAELTGATVVTTMRSPPEELALAARRFGVIGPRAQKVATLLVWDTADGEAPGV